MLDFEKLAQEFAFLAGKLKEASSHMDSNNYSAAAFILGLLHSICNNHSVTVAQLIPPKPAATPIVEVPIDVPAV